MGHGETGSFLASDVTAFLEHTRDVTSPENGPLALVTSASPVLAVLSEGSNPEASLKNVEEVESRGVSVLGCSSIDKLRNLATSVTVE